MNKEIHRLLTENIGNGVHIAFKGVDEDGSVDGVIRDVADSLAKLEWKDKSDSGEVDTVVTFVDINDIRYVLFDEPSAFDENGFWIPEPSDEDDDAQQEPGGDGTTRASG